MPVCAITGTSGLELQAMSTAADACTGVVLLQAGDVPSNPLVMDPETGAAVSMSVGGVWLAAWCIRAIRRVFADRDSE